MRTLLFTGGGGAGTEAIWRLLSARYALYFADADVDTIPSNIPAARKLSIPFANDATFLEHLSLHSKRHGVDVIIPGVDEELIPIRASQDQLALPEVLSPSLSFVKSMLDKLRCFNALSMAGLSAPRTLPVNRAHEIGFPLIVKPITGRGSRGVHVVHSPQELSAYKLLYQTTDAKLIAQEWKRGTEYTVQVSADRFGELNAIIPVRVMQKKGITIHAETERNEPIIDYVKRFHEAFRTSGIYNVQLIRSKGGGIYPFEVNPRISTTFCMTLALGFDPFSEEHRGIFVPERKLELRRHWANSFTTNKNI